MKRIITKLLFIFLFLGIISNQAINARESLSDSTSNPEDTICKADFSYIKMSDGQYLFFDSSYTINAVSRFWDFGDGDTATGTYENPIIHKYSAGISYVNVCMTVSDSLGFTCTTCKQIQIIEDTSRNCIANFSYYPTPNGQYAFTDLSYDPEHYNMNIISRKWSFPDSITYTDSLVYHSFDSTLTSANVGLTIVTDKGCQASVFKTITLNNLCDYFDINYNRYFSGAIQFYPNTTISSPIQWYWQFGDGDSSTLMNPTHNYAVGINTANVCLTATKGSLVCTKCKLVQVRDTTVAPPCQAEFSYEKSTGGSSRYMFTCSSTPHDSIVWHQWTTSDDSINENGHFFVHTFDSTLLSTNVCLSIRTSSGCESSICKTILFNDTILPTDSCHADFTYTQDPLVYRRKIFTDTSIPQNEIVERHWSVFEDQFGDNDSTIFDYTYHGNISSYNVCLYIRTSSGCKSTICKVIPFNDSIVPTDSCHADFTYSPYTVLERKYQFTDISTPQNDIVWRQWFTSDSAFSNDPTFTHTFDGSLTSVDIYLSIRTSSGCQSTISKTIQFNDTIVPSDSCHAEFTYAEALGASSRLYKFSSLSTPQNDIVSYRWTTSDDTIFLNNDSSFIYTFNPSSTSARVCLSIRTSSGCESNICKTIQFNDTIVPSYTLAGTVAGSGELLSQGVIVLYKKLANGLFSIQDANVVNNGAFSFENIEKGKYILFVTPHMALSNKYLPTYYVNKLHWKDAYIINLNSNIGGLTLQMVTPKKLDKGVCKISGVVTDNTDQSTTKSVSLKSVLAGISVPVYLYSQSGEAIAMTMTDDNNAFEFSELPYGTYNLKIEYINVADNKTAVSLSTVAPEVKDIVFNIENNTLSVEKLVQDAKFSVRNVTDETIAISINQSGTYTVSVISLSGKLIVNCKTQFESNTEKEITVGNLPMGIYVIKLQNNNGSLTKKIVK